VVSAGGNFTARSLTMATISSSYNITRSCGGGVMGCPTVDNTVPNSTGSFFNLDPFGFSWQAPYNDTSISGVAAVTEP